MQTNDSVFPLALLAAPVICVSITDLSRVVPNHAEMDYLWSRGQSMPDPSTNQVAVTSDGHHSDDSAIRLYPFLVCFSSNK